VVTAGDIYTIVDTGTAGYSGDCGPAASAEPAPEAVAVTGSGVLLADTHNNRVREVSG
jgi:hypothetical protein